MNQAKWFSSSERSILMIVVLLMCFTFYKDVSNKVIDSYNNEVKLEQLRKMNEANNIENFHFTIYDSCSRGLSPFELIIAFQFISNPILLFLFRSQKIGKFLFAILINSLNFLAYFTWVLNSYSSRIHNEFYSPGEITFGEYLLWGSTPLQQFQGILILFLLILQIFILFRFVLERFNAKLSLA